jgi:hypothetical protein
MWLIKTDARGDSLWSRTYGGRDWERAYAVLQNSDGDYLLAGGTTSFDADSLDLWLVCVEGNHALGEPPARLKPAHFALFPPSAKPSNPTKIIRFDLPEACHAKLEVFDLALRPVVGAGPAPLLDGWCEAGTHKVTFDGRKLPSGLYFVRLLTDDFSQMQKLVLIK